MRLPCRLRKIEAEPLDWPDYLAYLTAVGLPAALLEGADPGAFHTLGVRHGEENVATAIASGDSRTCALGGGTRIPRERARRALACGA
jgi:hypothetical protein